jgi:hypothetical protein
MAASAAFGAFTTCATLLFALIGTINRMKFSSDANIQKALGMVTDLFCAFIPQLLTMRDFYRRCYVEIDLNYNNEIEAEVYLGPGYWCYIICLFGACMRALFHWLTPLPGQGNGCQPKLPQSLIDLLDEDGDGQVSVACSPSLFLMLLFLVLLFVCFFPHHFYVSFFFCFIKFNIIKTLQISRFLCSYDGVRSHGMK